LSEYSAQTRAAIVMRKLMEGPQTARAMADATGLSLRSIYYVLDNIALELPITNNGGIWYMLSTDEQRALYSILAKLDADIEESLPGQAFGRALKIAEMKRIASFLRRFVCSPEPE
jgi:transcriptional antiterminator